MFDVDRSTFAASLLRARVRTFRRAVAVATVVLATTVASAAAPCGRLLASYFEAEGGSTLPCLVDLQENGLCFVLPGRGLDMSVRTLDAHLQTSGVVRPHWEAGLMAEATRFETPGGERLEIVLSSSGPFETMGTCRIVPER